MRSNTALTSTPHKETSFVYIPQDADKPLETKHVYVSNEDGTSGNEVITSLYADFLTTPLRRGTAGVIMYHNSTEPSLQRFEKANIRATILAMACGLHNLRFYGDVFVVGLHGRSICHQDIEAATISPDIRKSILNKLINSDDDSSISSSTDIYVVDWVADAAMENYFDQVAIDSLATVMQQNVQEVEETNFEEEGSTDGSEISERDMRLLDISIERPYRSLNSQQSEECVLRKETPTLCLHCRRPCTEICQKCDGAYLCVPPLSCSSKGWSHQCLCPTWLLYTQHRGELSTMPFFEWHKQLMTRELQVSEKPYREFLEKLNIYGKGWWLTETDGWEGGLGGTARNVELSRKTFLEGFCLEDPLSIPPSQHIEESEDYQERDERGLLILKSWDDYYRVRRIPLSSPVALLLTFPLTIYHSIQKYGEVPLTVANMLDRPMRLHVVGIEKELNFLDMFCEVGFILPRNIKIELVFIVRPDMVPPKCGKYISEGKTLHRRLTENTELLVVQGSYNVDLNPNFDCGSGPPDMIIGMNAGLFAYKSWRSVVSFLAENKGVVGVFTDYNEHSGTNCASLGGKLSRESLSVNPFRQPRTMPVKCMNLPQFSNGFVYVFNQQEIE